MRNYHQLETAIEKAEEQLRVAQRRAETLVDKKSEQLHHLRKMREKAEIKETGVDIIVDKVEIENADDWRMRTATITTTEGYVYGVGHDIPRAGAKVRISKQFYKQIKESKERGDKAKEQNLNCPKCGKINLWVIGDELRCPPHDTVALWDEGNQQWKRVVLDNHGHYVPWTELVTKDDGIEHDAQEDLPKHIEDERELEVGSDQRGEPID